MTTIKNVAVPAMSDDDIANALDLVIEALPDDMAKIAKSLAASGSRGFKSERQRAFALNVLERAEAVVAGEDIAEPAPGTVSPANVRGSFEPIPVAYGFDFKAIDLGGGLTADVMPSSAMTKTKGHIAIKYDGLCVAKIDEVGAVTPQSYQPVGKARLSVTELRDVQAKALSAAMKLWGNASTKTVARRRRK